MHLVIDILQKSIFISGFVLLLMIIIEYLHVLTFGKWNKGIVKNSFFQILISTILGATPGCAGTFVIVSLYTHNIVPFAALLAAAIASFGDEAFIIFATKPDTGISLLIYLSTISLIVSSLFLFIKIKHRQNKSHQIQIHDEHCCKTSLKISHQLRKITFQRALLLGVLLLLFINTFIFSHDEHGHSHSELSLESIIFILMLFFNVFVIITVPEHFLIEHIWSHVLKNHFIKLFLWTFFTVFLVHIIDNHISLQTFVDQNIWFLLIFAIVIGLLPLSGPHLIFFTLYLEQAIPFSILLANSIVQEGHAGIPLLAEDKRSFVLIKVIKIILALLVSSIMIIFKL